MKENLKMNNEESIT